MAGCLVLKSYYCHLGSRKLAWHYLLRVTIQMTLNVMVPYHRCTGSINWVGLKTISSILWNGYWSQCPCFTSLSSFKTPALKSFSNFMVGKHIIFENLVCFILSVNKGYVFYYMFPYLPFSFFIHFFLLRYNWHITLLLLSIKSYPVLLARLSEAFFILLPLVPLIFYSYFLLCLYICLLC